MVSTFFPKSAEPVTCFENLEVYYLTSHGYLTFWMRGYARASVRMDYVNDK